MWLPGHIAFSFLLCLPLIIYMKEDRALALAAVATFALLPDFLHLGMLRAFGHSFFGLGIVLAATLVPLAILFRPRPALLGAAVLAAVGHLIADLYIGSIWPFYPWTMEWVQFHQFNTPFDIRIEVILSIIALAVLLALRPWDELGAVRGLDRRGRGLAFVLAAPLAAMAGLQGAYFVVVSSGPGLDIFRAALIGFFAATFLMAMVLLIASRARF